MQITQCLHAAILVSDLERAEQFYGNVLGLSKMDRVLKFPGAWYQVGAFQIHLIVADSIPSDFVNFDSGSSVGVRGELSDISAKCCQIVCIPKVYSIR